MSRLVVRKTLHKRDLIPHCESASKEALAQEKVSIMPGWRRGGVTDNTSFSLIRKFGSGSSTINRSKRFPLLGLNRSMVADIGAAHPENHVLGNVRGVIANAF